MAPELMMPAADASLVTAKFDGLAGNEIIDRKLNRVFTPKAVGQARRQAATAAYNGYRLSGNCRRPKQWQQRTIN